MKMKPMRDWRLRTRFSTMVLFTNAVTLILLVSLSIFLEMLDARHHLVHQLGSVMETIGTNASAALTFGDTRTATEDLEALSADARVLQAVIFDAAGAPFARYYRDKQHPPIGQAPTEEVTFESNTVLMAHDIRWNGQVLGRIVIRADGTEFRTRAFQYMALSLGVLVLSLIIGYVISRHLSAIVAKPILDLASAAREVSTRHHWDVPLKKVSNDEVGELTECFGQMLSQLRDRDRELTLHRDHLEELVDTRTRELQLARERAEEAARMKSEFLANMSHEIRTPLNGVIGLTALALEASVPGEARDCLTLVSDSAQSLLGVLNDILDFSKIEAGHLSLECIPFDPVHSVSRLLKTLALRADEKALDLLFDVGPGVPRQIIGDPTRLQQVFTNLIGNAIKFTHSGYVKVSINSVEQSHEEVLLELAVTDSGIGIPADKQKTVFESFTQADGSTTRKYGGTGLGLAICRRLVTAMGGEITLRSEVGHGSTFAFQIRFPLAAETVAPSLDALRGVTVLIVDEHPESRATLGRYASELGLAPMLAANAREALDLVQWTRPRLLLVDYRLPDMNGVDLVRALKRRGAESAAPILMLSALAQAEFANQSRDIDLKLHLIKPVNPDELRSAVIAALAGRGLPQAEISSFAQPLAPGPRLQVLVAEDNTINQALIRRILDKLGHAITIVDNGLAAVDAAETGEFDLILMDCQMPELDGFEASERIRASRNAKVRAVPIIALTAYAMKGDKERCKACGMDDYLPKPLDIREAALKLNAIAASRGSRASDDLVEVG